jgi:uncharacterized membrane-anchored protein YhcB (DUF1043 family)
MEWVILVIVLGIIIQAVRYWEITLIFVVIGLIIGLFIWAEARNNRREKEESAQKAAEAARLRKQKEKEKERLQRRKEDQARLLEKLLVLGDKSITLFEKMPEHLKAAEHYLNQAEFEFSEGAFAPFWDAIEKTAKTLGRFDEGVRKIKNNSSEYTDLIPKYEGVPPQFPLVRKSIEKLSVGTSTAQRMKKIVRTAQRDFQFATIYEQRKTNQILIAGFTNLAQALEVMTWQITESIDTLAVSVDNLAGSMSDMALTIDQSMNAILSEMGDFAKNSTKHNAEIVKLESDRAVREKKALEMLDNLQRHRKPTI